MDELKRILLSLNLPNHDYYTFDEVVKEFSWTKSPDFAKITTQENSVYMPKMRGKSRTNQDDLSPRLKRYYQLILDPDVANNVFIMDTLNGPIGRIMFDYCATGSTIPAISTQGIKKMGFLLPSIEEQKEWADISVAITKKESELNELKEMLEKRSNLSEIKLILANSDISKSDTDLILQDESMTLEFKASLWTNYNNATGEIVQNQRKKSHELEDSVVKTIAAFLNTKGGVLLIGIEDRKNTTGSAKILGIECDYKFCKKQYQNKEGFGHSIIQILEYSLGKKKHLLQTKINIDCISIEGKDVCRIDVIQSPRTSHLNAVFVKTKTLGDEEFFTRIDDTTIHNSSETAMKYIFEHFNEDDEEEL